MTTGHDVADTYFNDIATTKFTIIYQIEKHAVTQTPVMIEPEAYGPHLLGLQRAFGS